MDKLVTELINSFGEVMESTSPEERQAKISLYGFKDWPNQVAQAEIPEDDLAGRVYIVGRVLETDIGRAWIGFWLERSNIYLHDNQPMSRLGEPDGFYDVVKAAVESVNELPPPPDGGKRKRTPRAAKVLARGAAALNPKPAPDVGPA